MTCRWIPVLLLSAAFQVVAQERTAPTTEKGKRSYAVGVDLAKALRRQGVALDVDALLGGMRDELSPGKLQFSDEELKASLDAMQTEIKMQRARPLRMLADRNRAEGTAFLAANKAKEGVVALDSGVQYKVLAAGTGALPAEGDTVTCNLRGALLDGTELDDTFRHGNPARLDLHRIVPGLKEALLRMPVGSHWQVWIPYAQGYGEKGQAPMVQPYATLVYELELLAIPRQ
jgi:FKBP-type peptidyl-prolyl cis-trans isomerase FklB